MQWKVDSRKKANTFNHFFCNIPKQIEKGITQKTCDDFLSNPIGQSF